MYIEHVSIDLKNLSIYYGSYYYYVQCNVISVVKESFNDTDILFIFHLIEPTGYMITIITTDVLSQNVPKEQTEYIEFHIKDEQDRSIHFNGDDFSFTLHLVIAIAIVIIIAIDTVLVLVI